MTYRLAVLRPEPGNAATVARAQAAGFTTLSLPLFVVQAIAWEVPDAAQHDALILTSANTLRFGGDGLAVLRGLPVFAVGPHTAAAARAAGFDVMATGDSDGAAIADLAAAQGFSRALYLTGLDRSLEPRGAIARAVPVYHSVARLLPVDAVGSLVGTVALLHSARAARRLGEVIDAAGVDRNRMAVAAFSPAIQAAAGPGWAATAVAAAPDDAALFQAIRTLPTL